MTRFLRYFSVFALAAVLACGFAFAACGGSSDDEVRDDDAKDAVTPVVTYVVTFDCGDGTTYAYEVDEGATVTAPEDPSRDGFMFTGWFSDSATTTEYDFSAGIYADTTIYAGWTERREGYNYVTFMWNYDDAGVFTVLEVKDGDRINSLPTPARTGYRYIGWYTEPECVNQYVAGSARVNGDFTLYARWLYGYVFEAEYTNLDNEWDEGREFSVYSDNYAGTQAIFADASCSNGFYVCGMLVYGSYLYFDIECDEAVDDAMLYFSFAATYGWGISGRVFNDAPVGTDVIYPQDFAITVNGDAVDYGSIEFDVSMLSFSGQQYTAFQEYYIGNISLVAGRNIIVLETTNSFQGEGGTQHAFSPFTDYMTIYTDSTLTWDPITSNLNGK